MRQLQRGHLEHIAYENLDVQFGRRVTLNRDSFGVGERLREARADLVVTIGGGQVVDTVKVALVCLAQNVKAVNDLDEWTWRPGPDGAARHCGILEPPAELRNWRNPFSAIATAPFGGRLN